jgi:hypothetical protein
LPPQQDDAARGDEDQEQHERYEVENEPERDPAEAEALKDEQDSRDDRNPRAG